MEYISAEEFLKQSVEVQRVFIDWWKPSEGDIYSYVDLGERCRDTIGQKVLGFFKTTCRHISITLKEWLFKKRKELIPLLTEGQLRKFIEDKEHSNKITIDCHKDGYSFNLYYHDKKIDKITFLESYEIYEDCDLLQAYWKVACEIASKEVNNE